MRTVNLKLSIQSQREEEIIDFIEKENIDRSKEILIQIFTGILDKEYVKAVCDVLNEKLPKCKIIGTSTDGEIYDNEYIEESMILSFSTFDYTNIKSSIKEHIDDEYQDTARLLEIDIYQENSKVIITFATGLNTNGEEYLNGFTLPVAGGLAGDRGQFKETFVFDNHNIITNGGVAVSLNSHILTINQEAHLNWEKVGKECVITKSDKNRVYEINNMTAVDFYKYYLGNEVESFLPNIGVEFPLLLESEDKLIARAVLDKMDDKSLIFGGNLEEGQKVFIGYGHKEKVAEDTYRFLSQDHTSNIESIFVYSCMARKRLLGDLVNKELKQIKKLSLSNVAGWFTYGEFYNSKTCNMFMNETLTFLELSEKNIFVEKKNEIKKIANRTFDNEDALINLLTRTSKDMEMYLSKLKIKNAAIDESLIYSETDLRGVITDVSQAFCEISGYTKEELIGKPHSLVRSPTASKDMFKDLWKKIKNGEKWEGILINKKKTGELYTTKATIAPMFFKGEIIGYNSQRIDITNLAESSKLAGMGEMFSLVAHQWKQPLAVLNILNDKIRNLVRKEKYDQIGDITDKIEHNVLYMSDTVKDFNDYFKNESKKELISVNSLIKMINSMIKPLFDKENIDFRIVETECLDKKFNLIKNNMIQIFITILKNAIDVLSEKESGERHIELEFHQMGQYHLHIHFRNNGGHIPKEIIDKIFKKNFTTKENSGSGLGLYMVKVIVEEQLGGHLFVENIDEDIVEFTIEIPVS